MKHNFIISTTRSELLKKQIDSFLKISNGRELEFYVFDDSLNKEVLFKREVEKIKKKNRNIKVHYFSLTEQRKIIIERSKTFEKLIGISRKDFVDCFKEDKEFRGIRSIQNKSIFIFYLINKDVDSILHKLDDDVFPYIATMTKKDEVKIQLYNNFFIDKEKVLKRDKKIITGNNFTIDSPSPLVQHIDFTEFLFNLINKFRFSPHDVLENKISIIPPVDLITFTDIFNLVNPRPITKDNTYVDVLKKIDEYIESYNKGIQRVVINNNKIQKSDAACKNKYFPGGCVSFFYKNIPTLTPNFGNQDLLWELFESLDGKNLFSSGFVGHIRTPSNRVSILDDLKDTSYKHQTSITYSVFAYLKRKNNSKSIRQFDNNFITVMNKWIHESKYFVDATLKNIEGIDPCVYGKYKKELFQIKKFLLNIQKSHYKIRENYKTNNNININKIMRNYYKCKKIFDKVMMHIIKNI